MFSLIPWIPHLPHLDHHIIFKAEAQSYTVRYHSSGKYSFNTTFICNHSVHCFSIINKSLFPTKLFLTDIPEGRKTCSHFEFQRMPVTLHCYSCSWKSGCHGAMLVAIIVGTDQTVALWRSFCYFPNCLLDESAPAYRVSASFDHPEGFACPSKNNLIFVIFKVSYCCSFLPHHNIKANRQNPAEKLLYNLSISTQWR